jgi:ribonuclease HI
MHVLKMYTDGACSGNQNDKNTGGWGSILEYADFSKELYGGEKNTTNNRMELTAVIEAFKALKRDELDVEIYTDSAYVANCFRKRWYSGWQRNGWMTKAKKPVENRDLWEELLELTDRHKVCFYHVKGHVNTDDRRKLDELYEKFKKANGDRFSRSEFIYILEKNNRADELAGIGIAEERGKK